MDTPDARPLAMAERLHHDPRRDPRAPRPDLTRPGRDEDQHTLPPPTARSPLPGNPAETLPPERQDANHHEHEHDDREDTPSPARSNEFHLTRADDRWFQA